MSRRLRVVIADDHPAVLIALARILEPHVDVVAVANDGDDLLQQVGKLSRRRRHRHSDAQDDVDACCHIRLMYPAVRVAVFC